MPAISFNAIDFETANHQRDSACQLGLVQVRNGEITQKFAWYIQPQPLHFLQSHIAIHGITPLEVANAPRFCELWDELEPLLEGEVLVAHNALFDVGVLRACLNSAGLRIPYHQFACTVAIARRTWFGYPSYSLKPLANRLGVHFKHHDALEDAVACAQIALAAARRCEASDWNCMLDVLGYQLGVSGPGGVKSAYARRLTRAAYAFRDPPKSKPPERVNSKLDQLWKAAENTKPLRGERLVFTGRLSALERDEAEKFAMDLGAEVQARVTTETSLVVLGDTDPRTIRAGATKSQKQRRAEALREAGHAIQLLDEGSFISLLHHRLHTSSLHETALDIASPQCTSLEEVS